MREASGPKDDIRMRPLGAEEGLKLQRFYNDLSQESRRLFRPLGWEAALEACERIAANNEALRYDLVLSRDEELLGWAFLEGLGGPVPTLGIGVSEFLQNQGWGHHLMKALVEEALRRGKDGIYLIHVKDNARAEHLYVGFGFERIGEHTGEDGLPYVQRRRSLTSEESDKSD